MRAIVLILGFTFSTVVCAHSQLMRQQAQEAIQRPAKVDVLPVDQFNQTSQPVRVQVVLRASAGQPIAALQNTTVEVSATQPSGNIVHQSVAFAPGDSSKTLELSIPEAGVSKLRVREQNDLLLESTNYINVAPARAAASPKKRSKKTAKVHKQTGLTSPMEFSRHHGPRLLRAAVFQEPNEPAAFPAAASGPRLMLKVSGENDATGVRADGVAFARVQVFYMDDTPPRTDIKVWVSPSNGEISANPIIIPKGQDSGEAHWTSKYVIPNAKLTVAGTNPKVPFSGSSEATVAFGAPILSLDLDDPPSKMTIVDAVKLTAVFFDAQGNPVPTATKRGYTFLSSNPVLVLQQPDDSVDPGAFKFSTMAIPTFVGESDIKVISPGYASPKHKVKITGLLVLLLCVIGGVLGGLLAFMNSNGKLWARIGTGVIVGAVASWAYVFIGLPHIQPMILHTQISVLFVSVLAAFAGVKTLSVITQALNFGF